MNFENFQNLARLYVVGALDGEELQRFQEARQFFGHQGEDFINECRKLNSVFALSLNSHRPRPETREKLLARIDEALKRKSFHSH